MAASANPSSGGHSNTSNGKNNSSNGGGQENGNGAGGLSATENSTVGDTQPGLRHNPGLSLDWTPEEQSTLEDLMAKFASENPLVRYAQIAQELRDKTVRDVALRCRWMSKKETGKRRKDDNISSRKNKDKKEKVIDSLPKSSQVANRSNAPSYAQSVMLDSDDGISYKAIGGATGQLLEQNAHALDKISANFSAFKIHENIDLFYQARTNILTILNDFNDLPELMKQMPPLPVKLNEELASTVLARPPLPNKS